MISIVSQLAMANQDLINRTPTVKARSSRSNKAVKQQKEQAKIVLRWLISYPNLTWTSAEIAAWASKEFNRNITIDQIGQWLKQWVGIYIERKVIKLPVRNTKQRIYSVIPGITLENLKDL